MAWRRSPLSWAPPPGQRQGAVRVDNQGWEEVVHNLVEEGEGRNLVEERS